MDKMLSIPKAAVLCGLHRATLWKYVKKGEIKTFKTPGGQYRIHRDDLKRFTRERGMYAFPSESQTANKILIVDDDPGIQKLLGRLLNDPAYQLEYASDGFDAGMKTLKFQPHLILLDLFMPGIDGFKVCENLKQNADSASIKIIAISGYDTQTNRQKILDCGADLFLPKPIDNQALLRNVRQLLNIKT